MPNYLRTRIPGGSYFFTLVAHNRRPLLTNGHGEYATPDYETRHARFPLPNPPPVGEGANESLREFHVNENTRAALHVAVQAVREEHPFIVEAWVLLPDHLHCLWRLPKGDADYPVRWAKIKRLTRHHLGMSAGEKLWQPRYWEHCIRDENDFARHADYIHWNPVKHGLVRCAADWPYSTFRRFAVAGIYPENWGIVEGELGDGKFGE